MVLLALNNKHPQIRTVIQYIEQRDHLGALYQTVCCVAHVCVTLCRVWPEFQETAWLKAFLFGLQQIDEGHFARSCLQEEGKEEEEE